jgi:hypothetical protein
MKKMAIFVEGYTELLFVDRLIREIAKSNQVQIRTCRLEGPINSPRMMLIKAGHESRQNSHFVMIFDCGGDDAVKDRMCREYHTLTTTGHYQAIVCLRDVYPKTHAELRALANGLPKFIPHRPVAVDFILSVMEIEAWFLAEHMHFSRISPNLTCESIKNVYGYDPSVDDMMLRRHPAEDLDLAYRLVGRRYFKGDRHLVNQLNFNHVRHGVADKFPYLRKLCDIIDQFLRRSSASLGHD